MPLPPAGAAANKAKLVVTLILCSSLIAVDSDVQDTGFRQAEACKTVLSPGIVLASWCFRHRLWNLKSLI
jgi:hypothetical protein